MKKIFIILIVLMVILVGVAVWLSLKTSAKSAIQLTARTVESSAQEQTNEDGPVSITAVPKASAEVVFQIELNTHTVSLDYDLKQLASLRDENQREYRPISWTGDPPGGHHRSGILSFGRLAPRPKIQQLIIKQVGGVPERQFQWTIRP